MNPRDMDAFYDAIKAYTASQVREDQNRTWCVESDIAASETYRTSDREPLGRWKLDPDDDVRYASERAWITNVFKAELTSITEELYRYPGFAPRRSKSVRNEELQTGDTTELDSFLASFNK